MKKKKLTETEIMRAFECCTISKCRATCEDLKCPAIVEYGCMYYLRSDEEGEAAIYNELLKEAIDLLNRKNAECKDCGIRTSESIEKLQKQIAEKTADNERLKKAIQVQEIMLGNQDYAIKKARAEAIKEFLDKADKRSSQNATIHFSKLEEIAKEMGVSENV